MELNEEWRPIPGYEGLYSVSNQGRVRSHAGTATRTDKIMKLAVRKDNRLQVELSKAGKCRKWQVHQLVSRTFHGEPADGQVCRHLNGDPQDNRPENLRWGTHSENTLDAIRHGTHCKARRKKCPRGHLLTGKNLIDTGNRHHRSGPHRWCRACMNARSWIRRHPEDDMQTLADAYYEKLTA